MPSSSSNASTANRATCKKHRKEADGSDDSDSSFEVVYDPWGITAGRERIRDEIHQKMDDLKDMFEPTISGTELDPEVDPKVAWGWDSGDELPDNQEQKQRAAEGIPNKRQESEKRGRRWLFSRG